SRCRERHHFKLQCLTAAMPARIGGTERFAEGLKAAGAPSSQESCAWRRSRCLTSASTSVGNGTPSSIFDASVKQAHRRIVLEHAFEFVQPEHQMLAQR